MSRIKVGASDSNALGIDDFDDVDLLMIESLVRGKSLTKTQSELRKIFRHDNREQLSKKIRSRYHELSENVLLKPLFKSS